MLRFSFIIFIFPFCIVLGQPDSINVNTIADSNYSHISDTSIVKIISYPEKSWLERNADSIIGSIIGALLASLVAILTVYLTARSNKNQHKREQIEIYCGLIYSIKVELIHQYKTHNYLLEEIAVIRDNSIHAGEFITDSTARKIPTQFLSEVRSKIINTEVFNTQILILVSYYINKCEILNNDLSFEKLIKLHKQFRDSLDFENAIQSYFSTMVEQLQDLKESIPDLIKYINNDLSVFGKNSDVDERDYLED